jgi:L-threonylcarbamoyladenylate synthase
MTPDELDLALAVLARGGVVAAATETFFGLLADARREDAITRVFALKGRDAARGIALLLPHREAWADLVREIPPHAKRLADEFWPGPLTLALAGGARLDPRLQVDGTIGVRLAGPSDAARIAVAFGAPLTATSANLTGAPPAETDGDVVRPFGDAIARGDLTVIPGRAPGGAPSTLVRIEGDCLRVMRWGPIGESDLAAVVPGTPFG